MSNESDIVLWNRVRAGDRDAYASVYQRYGRLLFSYGSYFSMDEELIKDCIQEIFIRIYQNHGKLKKTDNIRFYLYRALKNELLQNFRKKLVRDELNTKFIQFTVEHCADTSVEGKFIEEESSKLDREKVAQILNELTARQREIVYYRYVEELSFDEICILMNLNYQSAQNLLHRSFSKLRTIFQVTLAFLFWTSVP